MAKVFARSNGILYLQYDENGRQVQKSTRMPDTLANRRLLQKDVIPRLQKKELLGDFSSSKPKEFKHYSKKFLSDKEHLKTYSQIASVINVLDDRFGSDRIDRIKRGDIKDFVRDRLKINTPKTINNYLTPLRGVFDIAIDDEDLKDNPCTNIALPRHSKATIEPFSSQEVEKILSSCNGWMKLYLAISFYTGMRTGEVLALMPSDIDLDNRVIRVNRSINKGRITTPKTELSIREVPILDGLVPYLPKSYSSLWLLPKDDGKPYASFGGSKQREWSKLLSDCKIAYRKVYATRHTFIVSMLKNSNLSILEVAQTVGHSSTKMIIDNYGKFIKGEHLKIDRKISLFADTIADSTLKSTL